MVEISVIIPVYNVKEYLKECLDSVINQSFEDIEIICIDDGSTDSSLEILRHYQNCDDRVKVFSQSNHGPGNARNVGIDNSTGEYILFLDSDDYLVEDALKNLYAVSKENEVDFVLFKLLNFDNETGERNSIDYFDIPFLKEFEDSTFNHNDLGEKLYIVSVSAPGKLFRREFINNLRFPEKIIFEDTPFVVEAILMAERMLFLDEYYYMRRVRMDSITRSNFNRFSDCIEILNMVDDISKKYGVYDEYKELLFSRKYLNISTRFLEVDKANKKSFFDKIKQDLEFNKKIESLLDFNKVHPKAHYIYSSAINSNSFDEFEKSIKSYKMNQNDDLDNKLSHKFLKVFKRFSKI